ncbi:hypothetical protein FM104_12990 [Microbacterium esteraromaticum]|uniref:Uncharacterized protein n=1 Tax=Microbacterium esteraromaticum TaxID=57043 RepID=A0A1R4KHZ6_9MICO|nr:hypothetical protein [Microbacterium esteraromaticum]SJN43862.1 hypothetical protein FM104_12990 [Microbacterium esteraromaticum]
MPELPDLAPLYARHDESDRAWREERRLSDPSISWELIAAEREHYLAQEPVEFSGDSRPAPGNIVLDRDGDGWEFGRTRWTQLSGNDAKYLRAPGLMPPRKHGPYRLIGPSHTGDRATEWTYRTIRPRQHR